MPRVAASKKQYVCFFSRTKILCEANCRCIPNRVEERFSSPYDRVCHDLGVDFELEQLAGETKMAQSNEKVRKDLKGICKDVD
jgi:hypothetical protein